MQYKITVKRIFTNEQYAQEMREWKDRNKYNNHPDFGIPSQNTEQMALEVILTEEEFITVKKAVVEVIK